MWNAWTSPPGRSEDPAVRVRCQVSVSLDGFMAGPDQSREEPLGVGGEALHDWVVALEAWRRPHGREGGVVNASSAVLEQATAGIGATVMGRNMFGGGPGGWGDGSWTGWWGDEPPFHHPVFVLTHHEREPLEMAGGTTFEFVTGGLEEAIDRARAAAAGRDVAIGGGAETIRQAIVAGLLDELWLHVVPILLGAGERPLPEGAVEGLTLERRSVVDGPGAPHIELGLHHGPGREGAA